ncbi:hypothetical protein [Pantoea cypripedii]|uniref:Uncharacterized protein n=1 Tax=Pantoea cypripedii TaxID=55209 RepID=A0A1X1EMQ2_PANCY|nr:hypothetical protein [Pantoea cypripedii]MBP2200557.1 hypothetical protein [Pantoea cypripedii]ORM90054.1 hypothetical protein HA50_26140 [Pantoea cypripedii]
MSTGILQNAASALTPVTQADITRVMREYCFIRLDNGDEAFFHNGHWLDGADAASGEPSVLGLAQRAARAGGKFLHCMELPVPEGEWCWSDVAEQLARSAVTLSVRMEPVVTGCETRQGRGVHFCSDPLLSGINSNLWFPVRPDEDWFTGIEQILVMNGVAENVVSLTPLQDSPSYTDWKVICNRKIIA